MEIVTGMGGGDCGYHFKDGERYVVYTIRSGRDKSRLYSGACNRIKSVAEVDDITIEGRPFDKTVRVCNPRGQIKMITLILRRLNQS